MAISGAIFFIACHNGPAGHFAAFTEKLREEKYQVFVYASGPAIEKFKQQNISITKEFEVGHISKSEEEVLALEIAKTCSKALAVFTDVGHRFDIVLQRALKIEAPNALSIAYYDNPKLDVPGEYTSVANEVMAVAEKVLFANAHLAKKDQIGLGYYPLDDAKIIVEKRKDKHVLLRKDFFSQHIWEDKGQKVLVYFGSNNEVYFEKAFPAFLDFLSESIKQTDFSDKIIVLQQHPGAKDKNLDRQKMEAWIKEHRENVHAPKVAISEKSTDYMQALADGALYYQTSMGPLFPLAGIPILQIGHETYEDILIENKLCASVTCSSDFLEAINTLKPIDVDQKSLYRSLGIRENWFEVLKQTIHMRK